jgi:3-hydroxyisobutyrate dehydrogenase-like beta-hydroxyacid dehydrogenase
VASSAKLAINYLLGLNLQGIAETVLFAEKNGVSKEDMLNIINQALVVTALRISKHLLSSTISPPHLR